MARLPLPYRDRPLGFSASFGHEQEPRRRFGDAFAKRDQGANDAGRPADKVIPLPDRRGEPAPAAAVETPAADRFAPGDEVYAMPTHICPTCALHRQAYVVEGGKVTQQWEIVARDRVLSV